MTQPALYDRALAIAALVRTMRDHYLTVRCKRGASRAMALARMAADPRLAHVTLAHVALRLSCEGCHGGPDEVYLTETIFGAGPKPAGSVELG